jgi:hypothetical protein
MKPPSGNPDPVPSSGRLRPGVSGNPGGRPRGQGAFRKLCRSHALEAVNALVAALSESGERVPAAKVLLEFGFGKPDAMSRMAALGHSDKRMTPTAEEAAAAVAELRALELKH